MIDDGGKTTDHGRQPTEDKEWIVELEVQPPTINSQLLTINLLIPNP